MGNNPSKPASSGGGGSGSGSGGGPSSPTAASHSLPSRSQQQKKEQSNQQRRASLQPSIPSGNTTPSLSSSDTPTSRSTLSPSTNPSQFPPHVRSSSVNSSPNQKLRSENKMGNTPSSESSREKQEARRREREQDLQSNPVQVPASGQQRRQRGPSTQFEPSAPPKDVDYVPLSNLNFPPRLPLPIQEEVYTPGSPIISPDDLSSALHEDDVEGTLPHHTSLLSHGTIDEDEEGEMELPDPAKGKTVPTLIEWKQPGNKVYITGTFAAWSKKYRMHRSPNTNILSATLDLPPGTHHIKFIVDGEMQLSKELPTAVDYTNILVNYIEVSADDIPREQQPHDERPQNLHPPLVLPATGVQASDFGSDAPPRPQEEGEPRTIITRDKHYGIRVPGYLLDLDRDEKSHRFQRAETHLSDIPTPPSLPLFLSRSILNGTLPMKDDSSVLNMPNHTVLNHLATSSIKNEVLATSLTTRYKRKYVTTITYRPTTTDE